MLRLRRREISYICLSLLLQVFSCWNVGDTFNARPIIDGIAKFRTHSNEECFQGEPKLFCKDLWYHCYGRIDLFRASTSNTTMMLRKKIKALKGYVSRLASGDSGTSQIAW